MEKRKKYKKSPITEALYEIYFSESSWDDTIHGFFYDRIRGEFPKKQKREIQEAKIALGLGEAVAGVRNLPPWMQFVSDEHHRMIQLSQNLLVINQLSPYPHFNEWEPCIHSSLDIYKELAKPKKIIRLGLRYINRIEIPESQVEMEDYFKIFPKLPSRLGDACNSFMVRIDILPPEQKHRVLITFGSSPAEHGKVAFLLDIYDIHQIDRAPEEIDLRADIQNAHKNIIDTFEDSITDRLRELFGIGE